MKPRFLAAMPLLAAAAPALATGSIECRATDGSGIALTGAVGRTITSPLVTAHLRLGGRTLSTVGDDPRIAIGRAWIDAREIRVDLTDRDATRFEARLRARIGVRNAGTGTLLRDGVAHPVRCTVE